MIFGTNRAALIGIILGSLAACVLVGEPAAAQRVTAPPPTAEDIIIGLREKQGPDLQTHIFIVQTRLAQISLSEQEAERVIQELKRVEQTDTYAVEAGATPGAKVWPNRLAARLAVPRFEFLKTLGRLRALPIEHQVPETLAELDRDSEHGEILRRELLSIGTDAVPPLIEQAQQSPQHRGVVIDLLGEIGSKRAEPFLFEILRNRSGESVAHRAAAARALGGLHGVSVIEGLVEALRDDTVDEIDRCAPTADTSAATSCPARYFVIQHAASQALTRITSQNWGWLFNEDYKTWQAWQDASDRDHFAPTNVTRPEEERQQLVARLFDRYQSGRPDPSTPDNSLDDPIAIITLVADLKLLGNDVPDLLVKQYQSVVDKTPIWKGRLAPWTKKLLEGIGTPEAKTAAEKLNA